eukprot:4454528-Amphidinium_carterae.2
MAAFRAPMMLQGTQGHIMTPLHVTHHTSRNALPSSRNTDELGLKDCLPDTGQQKPDIFANDGDIAAVLADPTLTEVGVGCYYVCQTRQSRQCANLTHDQSNFMQWKG